MNGRPSSQDIQPYRPNFQVHDAQRQYQEHMQRKQSRRRSDKSQISSPWHQGRASLPVLNDKDADDFRQSVFVNVLGGVSRREAETCLSADVSPKPVRTPRKLQHKRRNSASPASIHTSRDENRLKALSQLESQTQPEMASTAVMSSSRISMPAYPGGVSEYTPLELDQPIHDYNARGRRQSGRMSLSMRPSFEKTLMHEKKFGDSYPTVLNRPRKLSTAATTVTVTPLGSTKNVLEAKVESSPWDDQDCIPAKESMPFQAWRPELGYHDSSPVRTNFQRTAPRPTGEVFAALPGEVLIVILDKLKELHLGPKSESCSTCWMRDLCSIAAASRKWQQVAQIALYEDIQLNGVDAAPQKKRLKLAHSSRLMLLRRSLRARPELAAMVRSLKVPSPPTNIPLEEYNNLVATLVMECPNFERLVGLYPRYDHTFSRLFHALSTRRNLKQMDWVVDPAAGQEQQRPKSRSRPGSSYGKSTLPAKSRHDSMALAGSTLSPQLSAAFLDHHVNWSGLSTISIHCSPGSTVAGDGLVTKTLRLLPSLKHLHLSRLSPAAFNDETLLSLPSLETLSLSHIPGVTSSGLSSFATRPTSQALKTLTLRHVNLDSLPALVRIFSNLTKLRVFSLVQAVAPILPEDTMIWLMPYLASSSLRKLHWDMTTPAPFAHAADAILSRSIEAGGFPSLLTLRTPNDPEGLFQSLCRPVQRTERATDRFRHTGAGDSRAGGFIARSGTLDSLVSLSNGSDTSSNSSLHSPTSPRTPTTPDGFASGGPTTMSPSAAFIREASDLRDARQAAQGRLEAARSQPRFHVHVTDEDEGGATVEDFRMAGFMGSVGSPICYDLSADPGARDDKGGLVGVEDRMADCGEDVGEATREGCIGRWNMSTSGNVDRKEKERWWHSERGRWRDVELA